MAEDYHRHEISDRVTKGLPAQCLPAGKGYDTNAIVNASQSAGIQLRHSSQAKSQATARLCPLPLYITPSG